MSVGGTSSDVANMLLLVSYQTQKGNTFPSVFQALREIILRTPEICCVASENFLQVPAFYTFFLFDIF